MGKGKVMRKRTMLSLAAVCTICAGSIFAPHLSASAASLSELQQKKQDVENKSSDVQDKINDKDSKISDINDKQSSLKDQLDALNGKIDDANQKISSKQNEIDDTNRQIDQLKKDISELKNRIEERNKVLKERARAIQENGGGSVDYVGVVLDSKSLSDFFDRLSAVRTIVNADQKIIDQQKQDEANLQDKQSVFEKKLADLQTMLADLKDMKAKLKDDQAAKNALVARLSKQKDDLEEEKMSLKEQQEILADQKASIEKAMELAKKELAEQKVAKAAEAKASSSSSSSDNSSNTSTNSSSGSLPKVSSGAFTRPAAGYISSEFGKRSGEFSGFHPGIDIANSAGTPVVAAADGVVFRAYHSSSYGNCVMISHYISGKLYTTVYAHLSSYSVSAGQHVSKGQQIGSMGSTGESSGPHLHFEIYNGQWTPPPHNGAQNPRNYINF